MRDRPTPVRNDALRMRIFVLLIAIHNFVTLRSYGEERNTSLPPVFSGTVTPLYRENAESFPPAFRPGAEPVSSRLPRSPQTGDSANGMEPVTRIMYASELDDANGASISLPSYTYQPESLDERIETAGVIAEIVGMAKLSPTDAPTSEASSFDESNSGPSSLEPIPLSSQVMSAWWDPIISQPIRPSLEPRTITISSLISAALQTSSQIQILSASPLIADTAIIESDAQFDWAAFMETSWNDVDEPVGNDLTTGGPPRFQNEKAAYEFGVQRTTPRGGQFRVGEQYGYERSNSLFFVPNDQGTARLTLNFTQPILRGGGLAFNTSTILLAQIQSGTARDDFSRELQAHLLEITQAYWNLYRERGLLLQRQRLFQRGEKILVDLEHRREMDVVQSQIVRVRAAVAARRADLFRAATTVKNAEGQIRLLVNATELGRIDEFELMPLDHPFTHPVPVEIPAAIQSAVQHRPEVARAVKEVKASGVRLEIAKNELLPVLDLFAETYVNGLRGQSDIGGAYRDQFQDGAPSYTTGLRFEVPFGNRAAKARFERRTLELRQLQQQFLNTLQTLQQEVEVAARDTITAHREISAKYESMQAAESEVEFLTHRWRLLPGDDRSVSLLLEDLLSAQERLALAELGFLDAQVGYNISLVKLRQATGTLLQAEQISVSRADCQGIPRLELRKEGVASFAPPPSGLPSAQAPSDSPSDSP